MHMLKECLYQSDEKNVYEKMNNGSTTIRNANGQVGKYSFNCVYLRFFQCIFCSCNYTSIRSYSTLLKNPVY